MTAPYSRSPVGDDYREVELSDDADVTTDVWVHRRDGGTPVVLHDAQTPVRYQGLWSINYAVAGVTRGTAVFDAADVSHLTLMERHSPPTDRVQPCVAVEMCDTIQQDWELADADMAALLAMTVHDWAARDDHGFSDTQLRRASYLVSIWASLWQLYSGDLPRQWMSMKNSNDLFAGFASPLQYAQNGGEDALASIRSLLEGRLGRGALDG